MCYLYFFRSIFQIGLHILVAAARECHHDHILRPELQVVECAQRVGRLQSRQYAVEAVELIGGGQRLFVGHGDGLRAARAHEVGGQRADARIVEAGRYGVGFGHFALVVGDDERARAVEYALGAHGERGRRPE